MIVLYFCARRLCGSIARSIYSLQLLQGSTLPKVVNLHLDIDIQPVDTFDEAWDPPLTLANQGDVALTVSNHSSSASIEMCAGAFTQASRRGKYEVERTPRATNLSPSFGGLAATRQRTIL